MGKFFTKRLFLVLLSLFAIVTASAQTITVGAVDPGPYGRGSSISVPFKLTGCITASSNVYTLQLSDAAGNFGSPINIGTYTGFYATFVNGVIPNLVTAGTNYKVRVVSSIPVLISSVSASFTINAIAGIKAGASSNQINAAVDPEVFGSCVGTNNRSYTFINTSDNGNPATATFFNELTQANEGTISINGAFPAKLANYTVTVKTVLAGIVGTKSYQLINNVANNSFTITGNGSVCLGAGNVLEYNVDITGNNGIQNNYPGLRYNIKWGDNSTSTYTLCDIIAANGKVSHAYTLSSCGNVANNQKNVFQIDIQPTSPYCTNITQPVTTYAKVLAQPQNRFVAPIAACLGSQVIFTNNSVPGDDPNSTTTDCRNIAATYTWLVDGIIVATGRPLSAPFVYTFATSGNHDVTLRFENNNGLCDAGDLTKQVCVQKAPTPNFTIPATYCLATGPLTPVNTSVVDEVCNTSTTYTWTLVSGPAAGVTFAANAKTPSFNFSQVGVYKFRLDIATLSCGTVTGPTKTIVVNDAPTAVLSPDANQCGKGVTLNFNNTPGSATQTTLTGTAQPLPTTYIWTVTSAAGGTSAFANGTTANSQYPSILFNDYDTYTITVTHTNGCGAPASDSQKLTFVAAPTVSAGPPQNNICEGTPIILTGTPGVGGLVTAVRWTSATGGTFTTPNAPNATYLPSVADVNAGQVLLTYTVTTSLATPCNQITSTVLITIVKKATVTSVSTLPVCSGSAFTYNITSANPATTFTWTAALTSGTATGFNPGSGAVISEVLTNNTNADAVVTYTITPTLNGCPGTPFPLRVTVKPLSVVSATAVSNEICSNQPANITVSGSLPGTTFTWTSTAGVGITGNIDRTTPFAATSIQDVLVNNSAVPGIVTYTITPYNGTCPGVPKQVSVTVKPLPIPSLPGPDESICASTTYNLKGNDPAPGTGQWTVTSGQTGVTFSGGGISPNAIASGLVPGQVYKFTWTITAAATCPPSVGTVTITDDLQTVPGTTTGATAVCAGTNSGSVILQGYVGNVLRWEQSINGGTNWTIINRTLPNLPYNNLTQTTQYRAIVQSGSCVPPLSSTITIITVNQPPVVPDAGSPQTPCNANFVDLHANSPLPFTGTWTLDGPPISGLVIVDPSNPQTRVTGLQGGSTYVFRWTINGALPCASPSATVTITDLPDVPPSFTQNKITDCGEFDVQFTNTSPNYAGVTYVWDFGDGSLPNNEVSPLHHFIPDPSGKDIVYKVKLTTTVNCTARPPYEQDITVHPATPKPRIFPDQTSGCGNFTLTVENSSLATYKSYIYILLDENGGILQQKPTTSDPTYVAQFPITPPLNPKTYKVFLRVTDFCNQTVDSDPIDIKVSPSTIKSGMFVTDYDNKCFPVTVKLHNNSTGGDKFQFTITNTDGDIFPPVDIGLDGVIPYRFPKPGIYYISMRAANNCGPATATNPNDWRIEVFERPRPDFKPSVTSGGCGNLDVTFTNTTISDAASPSGSLAYDWDFGDGSPIGHDYSGFVHSYAAAGTYTVTLTATNVTTGCFDVMVKTNVVTVFAKPIADFTASPGFTTAIPNYRFTFTDATTMSKAVKWTWTFGDGQTATGRNVNHTYGDVGKFNVTLDIVDDKGCTSTITKTVEITGIPGFLYLPNAFQPSNGATDLQKFTAKGSGIAKWQMQIFNNWGQLIWQTTTLGGNGQPVEGWDGTFKGAAVQQGVYIWQASATFINGTEWKGMSYNGSLPKRTGYIHLIR